MKNELKIWKSVFDLNFSSLGSVLGGKIQYPVQINLQIQYYFTKIITGRHLLAQLFQNLVESVDDFKKDSIDINGLLHEFTLIPPHHTQPGYSLCVYIVGLFMGAVEFLLGNDITDVCVRALAILESLALVDGRKLSERLKEYLDAPGKLKDELFNAVSSIVSLY
jgi:hypothetical protein